MALKPIRRPIGTSLKAAGKPSLKPKPKTVAGTGFGQTNKKAKPKPGGAFAKADTEFQRYEERRNQPFRASVAVGESGEYYFLDRGEPWTRYEHNIGGGPNSRGEIYACIKDSDENCPACAKENKEGAFVMFLTSVQPYNKYTPKKGKNAGKTIVSRWRKQLFPIKIKMAKKYQRLYEAHGTFRGMVVRVHRDNQMDAGTGSDVEFVRMMTEKEIQTIAKTLPKVTDAKMKADLLKANLAEPFDYDKTMPMPNAKKLAAMIGAARSTHGSADMDDEEAGEFEGATGWGSDDDEE
jgi:hypothetical protein